MVEAVEEPELEPEPEVIEEPMAETAEEPETEDEADAVEDDPPASKYEGRIIVVNDTEYKPRTALPAAVLGAAVLGAALVGFSVFKFLRKRGS